MFMELSIKDAQIFAKHGLVDNKVHKGAREH